MPFRQSGAAADRAAGRVGAPASCTPTIATTTASAATIAAAAASSRALPDAASRTAAGLGGTAGRSSGRGVAWMARFRRLTIRYERREDIHLAFTTFAAAILCLKQIRRLC